MARLVVMVDRFDFEAKNIWRQWAWNQLSSRLRKGDRVIVLCGDGISDAIEAEKRGFDCIGVDVKLESVKNWRKHGRSAIQDSVLSQIKLLKPNGCILDWYGGSSKESYDTSLVASSQCDATVLNFLRGREGTRHSIARLNATKKRIRVVDSLGFSEEFCVKGRRRKTCELSPSHRGRGFFFDLFNTALMIGCDELDIDFERYCDHFGSFLYAYSSQLKPSYRSYKSVLNDTVRFYDSVCISGTGGISFEDRDPCKRKSIQKAAAFKAIATMRRTNVSRLV
jgi:hypothetical protein